VGEEIELPEGSILSEAIEVALARHGEEFRTHLLDSNGNVHPSLVIAVNDVKEAAKLYRDNFRFSC